MALPKGFETPRGLELLAKAKAAEPSMRDWPMPTKDDFTLGVSMIAVIDRSHGHAALRRVENIHSWLAAVTVEFEKQLLPPIALV
jgi:hypothetical protein